MQSKYFYLVIAALALTWAAAALAIYTAAVKRTELRIALECVHQGQFIHETHRFACEDLDEDE